MLKKYQLISKTVFQMIVYLVEMVGVSSGVTWVLGIIYPAGVWGFLERCLLIYAIYQILVIVILTNMNDIKRDSYLALSTLLKQCIVYSSSRDELLRSKILKSIVYQLDSATLNYNDIRNLYIYIRDNLDSIKKSQYELELINTEHLYELEGLNWRYSFLLRIIK